MPRNIVILEDDQRRIEEMNGLVERDFSEYSRYFFDDSGEMISFLEKNLNDSLIIALDHDLPISRNEDGTTKDHGDGRDLSSFLMHQNAICPVIIHSTNRPAAISMEEELKENGWKTVRMSPYGDLEWIRELWYPTFCDLIRLTHSDD